MMRLKGAATLIAVGSAAALLLAGCSGSSSSAGSSASASSSKSPASDINAQPASALKDGGTLRLPISQWVAQWNYNELDGPEADAGEIETAIYPQSFILNDKGEPQVVTDYYTSIKKTSDDPQTIEYDINPKAKWSDGTPITWKDLQAQWQAVNGTNSDFNVAATNGYDQIKSVERGSSDTQAIVTYAKPYADWQSVFSPLYPAAVNSDPNAFNTGLAQNPGVTAGPFKVEKLDEGAQTVTLTRDPNWWGAKPKLDTIIFRVFDSPADIQAFANGEIDAVGGGMSGSINNPTLYQQAKQAKGGVQHAAFGQSWRHIDFSSKGVLKDLSVRQAVAKAINRQAIANAMTKGMPLHTPQLDSHIFFPSQTGVYKDTSGTTGKFDPSAAKALLKKAGYTVSGEGDAAKATKDGQQLTVNFVIPSGVPASLQTAQLVQQMESQIGVKVDIQQVPSNDFFTKYVTPGAFDLTIYTWVNTGFPSGVQSIYTLPKTGNNSQNPGNIGSPEIDSLLTQAVAEPDRAKAAALYNQADAKIWDLAHSLALFQYQDLSFTKKGLANWGSFGLSGVDFAKVGWEK